ncbi:DUF4286 family protein [Ramlibacter sp. WS9]|uniref:DUF4286 family protein n=1 Tax=Ramlibacter sp. WS9 TaxID=1882741 RepID=UPI0011419B6A|nr:DUF4286 family protein [Ramlibacter sp. WS9]ROZ71486.1 hypothetical protein EEB15_20790 [Ramlibacter sp. WS9]
MALLGKAAIAMWWDMAPEHRDEFQNWHSHEHFPERMGIPGFLRGARWAAADGGEGFFIMYELADYETLSSPGYLARLNSPTPWSTKLMPHHRNMVRSQCRVLESVGGAIARHALTLRLSPEEGSEGALRAFLAAQAKEIASHAGTTAAHLLQTQTPQIAATTEQKIRGADEAADWIFVACGYELAALEAVRAGPMSADSLASHGAAPGEHAGLYSLCHSHTASDTA